MPSVTNGVDSLYSTVQMPAGVPVATLAMEKLEPKILLCLQLLF